MAIRMVIPPEDVAKEGMQAVRWWLEMKEREHEDVLRSQCVIRDVLAHRERELADARTWEGQPLN